MNNPSKQALALTRLLHLASPALPVGAFSYSQGLEWIVENSTTLMQEKPVEQVTTWIGDMLMFSMARCEAPAMITLMRAWNRLDAESISSLNERFIALRETAELRAETLQMGYSLTRLLLDLEDIPIVIKDILNTFEEIAYPTVWAAAAIHWQLTEEDAVQAYLWAWLENQVMAAVKLVPLGQTAGQKMLLQLMPQLPCLAQQAIARADEGCENGWENFTPGLALASSLHETQYTRLFRS